MKLTRRIAMYLTVAYSTSSVVSPTLLAVNISDPNKTTGKTPTTEQTTPNALDVVTSEGITIEEGTHFDVTTFEELEQYAKIEGATLTIKNTIEFSKALYIETDDLTIIGDRSDEKPSLILNNYAFALRGERMHMEHLNVSGYTNNIGIRIQNTNDIVIKNVILNSGNPVGLTEPLTGIIVDATGEAQYTGNVGIFVENSQDITLSGIHSSNHRNAGIQLRSGSTIYLDEGNVHVNDKVAVQSMDEPANNLYNTVEAVIDGVIDQTKAISGTMTPGIFNEHSTLSPKYYKQKHYEITNNNQPIHITEYVRYQLAVVHTNRELLDVLKLPNSYIVLANPITLHQGMDVVSNNIVLDGLEKDKKIINIKDGKFPIIKNKNFIVQNIHIEQDNTSEAISVYGAQNTTLKNLAVTNTNIEKSNAGIDIASNAKNIVVDTITSNGHKQQGIRVRGTSEVIFKGTNSHTNDTVHLQVEQGSHVTTEASNYQQDAVTSETLTTYSIYEDVLVSTFAELKEAIQYSKRRIIIADDIVFEENLVLQKEGVSLIGQKGYMKNRSLTPNESNRPVMDLQGYSFSFTNDDQGAQNLEITGYARNLDASENRIGLYVSNSERITITDVEFIAQRIEDITGNPDLEGKNLNRAVGLDIVGSTNVTLTNLETANHAYQAIRVRDSNGKPSEVLLKGESIHYGDEYALQIVSSKNIPSYQSAVIQERDFYTIGNYIVEGDASSVDSRVTVTYYKKGIYEVHSQEELLAALENRGSFISLGSDIQVTTDASFILKDGVILNGNGYTLDLGGVASFETKGKDILIKNMTVQNSKAHGLHIYNSYNVVIDGVVLRENTDFGMFVNGSKVEIRGNTRVEDNTDGGIWITRSRTLLLDSQKDSHVTIVDRVIFKERHINLKLTNLEMLVKVGDEGVLTMQNNQLLFKNEAGTSLKAEDVYDVYVNKEEQKGISQATADILVDKGVLDDSERGRLFSEITTDYMNKRIWVDVTDERDLENLLKQDGRLTLGLEATDIQLKGDGVFDNTVHFKQLLEIASRVGAELFFPEGTYNLSEDIILDEISPSAASNVKLVSDANNPAIINGTPFLEGKSEADKRMLKIKDTTYHHPLNYFVVENLIFDNIGFEINGPYKKGVSFIENGFANGEFSRTMNTAGDLIWRIKMVPYIEVKNSQYVVNGNVMMRDVAHPGKGIATYATRDTEIKGNYFGDLGNLEHAKEMISADTYAIAQKMEAFSTPEYTPNLVERELNVDTYYEDFISTPVKPAADGNFFTGINIFRYDRDTLIEGNYFNMMQTRDMVTDIGYDVLIEGIGASERRRDHLIYAKSYDGLSIIGNYFEGMSNDAAGGVKIRNGENAYIGANYFKSVPLLTYIYPDLTKAETLLHDHLIYNNLFHQKDRFAGEGTGILYYQSFRDGDDLVFKTPQDAPPEDLVWNDSYGDVENFMMYNNQFFSDERDRITISGRVQEKVASFFAHGNTYVDKEMLVHYNTAGNLGIKESTEAELEAQIHTSATKDAYEKYQQLAIPYQPFVADKGFLEDLVGQTDYLLQQIMEQNKIGNTTDVFTLESIIKLKETSEKAKALLAQPSPHQGEINLALTELDQILQSLEVGTALPPDTTPPVEPEEPEEPKPPTDSDSSGNGDDSNDNASPDDDNNSNDNSSSGDDNDSNDDSPSDDDHDSNDDSSSDNDNDSNEEDESDESDSDENEDNYNDEGSSDGPSGEVEWVEDFPLEEDIESELFTHEAYLEGYEDGTIRPNDAITRGEVATLLDRLIADSTNESIETIGFVDVNQDDWYHASIERLASLDILAGYPDGTFRGDRFVTRAEFTAFVNRMVGEQSFSFEPVSFSDLSAAHWASNEITRAAHKGYVVGYEDGHFKPNAAITRAEAIVILNRSLERVPDTTFIDNMVNPQLLKDLNKTHWAFYDLIEATTTHDYHLDEGNKETWVSEK